MTFDQYLSSLKNDQPPGFSDYLKSLWYERKGNWTKAHTVAQDIPDRGGSWIHAYLHRVEGDQWNSNYWYAKAGREMPGISLEEEWKVLVDHFLEQYNHEREFK
jgi:hypothetical protein